jgi:hypothetical protein
LCTYAPVTLLADVLTSQKRFQKFTLVLRGYTLALQTATKTKLRNLLDQGTECRNFMLTWKKVETQRNVQVKSSSNHEKFDPSSYTPEKILSVTLLFFFEGQLHYIFVHIRVQDTQN